MDLESIHNPYDFANPVTDVELFVGRQAELDEIRYYLDHARTAPRPISLALLGERAAGKTSVLNMTAVEASARSFCVARVDLDESDIQTQIGFFFKLFDAVLTAACDLGAFGGIFGKTYDTYLDIVNAFSIPDDKTFCPFLFPLQYARAMSVRNFDVHVSDHNLRRDLNSVRQEVDRPVVILFDEGNVLARSRVHLEKLRNAFMNLPGFMLVLTGTKDLFPVMDEVFSPIVRQFKKINIGEFRSRKETEACIRKPLEKLGLTPEQILDEESGDVREIHELSGGRPYEIQLICHLLFRRVQAKRAAKMKLDLSVLDDLRKELETARDVSALPVLSGVGNLEKERFEALQVLAGSAKGSRFEDLWGVEYIINGTTHWTKAKLLEQMEWLLSKEILRKTDENLSLNGDEFDRIYTKYVGREKGVNLNLLGAPPPVRWFSHMSRLSGRTKALLNNKDSNLFTRRQCDAV